MNTMKFKIPFLNRKPVVSVVRLAGMIGSGGRAQLNDEILAPVIGKAFSRGRPKAVALSINSPGGSPVQSSLIAARIRREAEERGIPVHAFVEDVAASGGYWLAAAADDIWVDENSVLGSIGVIAAGFGAHALLERHGIERRIHTAGKSKSMLDPFNPEKEEDVLRLQSLLDSMHESFIGHVKSRRGDRLSRETDLFTGEFWLGTRAVEFGLADGVAHMESKLREIYGEKVRFSMYGPKKGFFRRFGAEMARDAMTEIEERAAYARFGL